jgi:hypothetical protein
MAGSMIDVVASRRPIKRPTSSACAEDQQIQIFLPPVTSAVDISFTEQNTCGHRIRRLTMHRPLIHFSLVAGAALTVSAILPATIYAGLAPKSPSAATALQAVRMVVRPYVTPGYNFANCTRLSPRLYPNLICPETARLRHWLRVRRLPMGSSGLPFCRCQSAPRTVQVWLLDNNSRVAHVNTYWNLDRSSFTDTFVVVHGSNGWLVDDEYCAGRPGTSVYTSAGAVPCR